MAEFDESLPAEVLDALRRGQALEAIRLLRGATGMELKHARAAIDDYLRRHPRAPGSGGVGADRSPSRSQATGPASTIETIRRLREQTGMGRKEARDTVDAARLAAQASGHGLSPGEVPRTTELGRLILAIVVIALVGWLVYRFFGRG